MINIGDILRTFFKVSDNQLKNALEKQKKEPHRLLGEILVDMRAVDPVALKTALDKQDKFRNMSANPEEAIKLSEYAIDKMLGDEADNFDASPTGVYKAVTKRKE